MEKHFCVTVYLFNKKTQKFIFIRHKKLQKWFPPGGHVDLNENPVDAARREVFEETGLQDINFINSMKSIEGVSDLLIQPFGTQLNRIKEEHEHMDFIYLATMEHGDLILNEDETEGIKEFSLEEILDDKFDTLDNQRGWCKYFVNYLK